ncbi:MAG: hypothetical protein WAV20_03980 [Blastocatellia bacterium]
MKQQIKVEIRGKDEFWRRAFFVEWDHQFPDRKLSSEDGGHFIARPEWFDDLARVAAQAFCTVARVPENPRRRQWMSSLIPWRNDY